MPCVDHDYNDVVSTKFFSGLSVGMDAAHERADQLANEICKLRQLVYDIGSCSTRNLPGTIRDRINDVITDHIRHREKDREAARQVVVNERKKVEQNIATIERLGGFPGKEMCLKVVEFQKHEKIIANSDLMDTGLY